MSEYKHFRLILENMIDLVSEIDHEGRVKYISPSYKKLLGYDLESLQKYRPMNLSTLMILHGLMHVHSV